MRPMHRLLRPLLLATTALLAPTLALAQAPNARPQGGQVVAGQAGIAQSTGRTQVNQTTNRAVIEWRGFDIGANHQVDIRQPNGGSWSLQRVTGPDPSAIAGRLTSNGGVAIVNPAGVVFQNGAQVDVAGLIATTADTTNEAFMAGRMAFDGAPRPGARVENRGTITVRDQGLAALVGPVAANSGTIRARLGRVAVAGGEAFALDMNGDGLLSFDVTRQVRSAPSGAAALATNSGTIEAEGGHVLLTARAASGVLETLVEAGGSIAAAGGTIAAHAAGGGVRVPAGATLDASGPAGGGRVTVGAGADSRLGTPTRLAARATVERGATLRADATRRGNGGRVIVHSERRTEMRGAISARGAGGGRGGEIEVSSRGGLLVDGALRAGPDGTVLIDPEELHIVETPTGATEPEEIAASTVNATEGHLVLQAERRIRVRAEVNRDAGPLTLETTNAAAQPGDGVSVEAPLAVLGDLRLRSAGDITQADDARIAATTLHAESRAGSVRLEAFGNAILALDGGLAAGRFDLVSSNRIAVDAPVQAGALRLTSLEGIALFSPVSVTGTAELVALGFDGITQAASGAGLSAGLLLLESPFAAIRLDGAGNRIAALGDSTAIAGLTLRNAEGLRIAGTLNGLDAAVSLRLDAGDLTQEALVSRLYAESLTVAAPGGSVLLEGGDNLVTRFAGAARDVLALDAGRALLLDGRVSAAEVRLAARGDLEQVTDALVVTPLLRARAIGGGLRLTDPLNEVAALGDSGADTVFALATSGSLTLAGRLAAPEVVLVAGGGLAQGAGGSLDAERLRVLALTGDVALAGPGNRVAVLDESSAAGGFALATTGALQLAGTLQAGGALALTADALDLAASLAAPAVTLRALAGGIEQNGGTLATAALRAEATERVRLDAAGNAIAAVSGRAGPPFGAAPVGTPAAAPLFRVATRGDLAADDIAAPEVVLLAGGAIAQPAAGAGIAADLLHVEAGGRVELGGAANAIGALLGATAPGGLVLRSTTGLHLLGAVTVPSAEIEIGGDLTQSAGAALSAGTLRLRAGGSVTLTDARNALPRLLGAEVAGSFALGTSGALTLDGFVQSGGAMSLTALDALVQASGHVEAPSLLARSAFAGVSLDGFNRIGAVGGGAMGSWRLRNVETGALTLLGLVAAPEVQLILAGDLEQGGGALRTEVLALDVAGRAMLDGPDHRVAALSGRAGELWLSAGGALEVTGALDVAGALGLSADRIGLLAPVSAGGAGVLVALGGDIAQAGSGAALTLAGGLQVHAAGAVALDGAGNRLARLLAGSAGAGFALADAGALTVAGGVAGETVTLRSGGVLTLDGAAFQAGRAVLLASPAGIAAGAQSRLDPLDPARLPVLLLDTRAGGLTRIPDGVQPDRPGLAAAAQPTQLAQFGAAGAMPAGGLAFDLVAGASPVFLLLDSAPSVGTLEAGRLGVLGRGGSAFLVGVLGGVGGAEAASLVSVAGNDSAYRFNDCPMGVANCGASPPPPPVEPPVEPPVLPPVEPPVEPPVLPPVLPPAEPPVVTPGGTPTLPVRIGLAGLDAPGDGSGMGGEDAPPGWAAWPGAWPPAPLLREEEE